jgi:hypothetical protein
MQAALLQQLSDPDGVNSTGKVQQRCLYYSSHPDPDAGAIFWLAWA